MKLRTSLFNRTIIVNLLQRYWVGYAAYLCALGAVLLFPLINALQENGWYPTQVPYYASLLQVMRCADNVLILNFITVAAAAALLFSYLYNARHTGMMASLPVKRETMYCSVSAAALVGMLLCNLVIGAAMLGIELLYGQVHLGAIGMIMGISVLSILAFFGLAAFCCMLTGNIFAGPAVYLIFNFLGVGTQALTYNLLQKIVYGMPYSYRMTTWHSPVLHITEKVGFSYERIEDAAGKWVDYTWTLDGMPTLALYAAVGLVFLGLGLLLYKKRRMETAGDTIAIEILKPIFRFCCTVGGGLLLANLITNLLYEVSPTGVMAAAYLALLMIVGGVLGYFISKMLIERTVWVFRSGWRTMGLYAVAMVVLMGCIETDVFGYERRVPDLSEVVSITISTNDINAVTFREEENLQTLLDLHTALTERKAFHEIENGTMAAAEYIARFSEPSANFVRHRVELQYQLENGKMLSRRYMIAYGPDEIRDMGSEIRQLETLLNTEEGIRERCTVDYPVTADNIMELWVEYTHNETYDRHHFSDFTHSETARFYNECVLPDIAEGKLGVIDIVEDLDYAKSKYNATLSMTLYQSKKVSSHGGQYYENTKHIIIYPTVTAERTMAFLAEYNIIPATVYDSQLADGYHYDDLGIYRTDGEDYVRNPYDDKEVITQAMAADIIGGDDGPTAMVVTG